ncbi:MAG: hypothetical protein SGI72_01985 [Planctomycetota bacterium]|nr:hypothetical protein [Planctomycetota bacterium]
MKLSSLGRSAIALAVTAVASIATAQILRVNLTEIVAKTNDAVLGTIVKSRVTRIDHPIDGPELYFTTLSIEGTSLETAKPVTVDVSFMGGFVDAEHGSFNSEAPSADDVKIGNKVVCFYAYNENMGGDFAGNEIFGWHGGIYRTFERAGNVFVQGRGEAYAIPSNIALNDLKSQIAVAVEAKGAGK